MVIEAVKFFNIQKGFGFIKRADGQDVFVHFKDVQKEILPLVAGERVEFRIFWAARGLMAKEVRLAAEGGEDLKCQG